MKKLREIRLKKFVQASGNQPEVCPYCMGTGVVVEVDERGIGYARPCDCLHNKSTGDPLRRADIPKQFRHCTLESFAVVGGSSLRRAKETASRFVKLYPNVNMGLMFQGPPGVGKTHLAIGIVKELIETKNVDCLYVDFADLLSKLRSSFNNPDSNEDEILRPLRRAEVLLIDDLGAMKISDWTMDILSYVINNRYKSGRTLLVTTNFMDRGGDIKTQTLEERVGSTLRSRLYEMCKLVEMIGNDFRKTQKKDMPLLRDPALDE